MNLILRISPFLRRFFRLEEAKNDTNVILRISPFLGRFFRLEEAKNDMSLIYEYLRF
jgi:hypothetical protein